MGTCMEKDACMSMDVCVCWRADACMCSEKKRTIWKQYICSCVRASPRARLLCAWSPHQRSTMHFAGPHRHVEAGQAAQRGFCWLGIASWAKQARRHEALVATVLAWAGAVF